MELKEFVKETLVQIVKGVNDANSELSDTTSFVPSANLQSGGASWKCTNDKSGRYHAVVDVDFDVMVNAEESKTKSGGVSIEVLSIIGVGRSGENGKTTSSANRVRFTIPLALPTEPEDKLYTKK